MNAIQQIFNKNFMQGLLSVMWSAFAMTWYLLIALNVVHITEANKDIVRQITDLMNTGVVMVIIGFWIGSSKGSQDKTEMLKPNTP